MYAFAREWWLHADSKPVTRSENVGVRKTIIVDLTSGSGRGGLPDTKSGWVRLKPYNQTLAWDRAPTVLHCLSLCLNTIQYCVVTCMAIELRP